MRMELFDGAGDMVGAVSAWLASAGWWLAGAALLAAVVWWGVYRWWRARAVQSLRDRVTVDLVPSVGFAPDLATVGWFAGQLSRVPAAAGVLQRRASAVRVRLACQEGQLAYRLEGPARAKSVLRLSAYPGVEVVETGEQPELPRIHFEGAPPLGADVRGGA